MLQCLQNPLIKLSDIQEKVQANFMKASRRLSGLSLLQLLAEKVFAMRTETAIKYPQLVQI